jgi:hypothetical protein
MLVKKLSVSAQIAVSKEAWLIPTSCQRASTLLLKFLRLRGDIKSTKGDGQSILGPMTCSQLEVSQRPFLGIRVGLDSS